MTTEPQPPAPLEAVTVSFPDGYEYRATRYADVILRDAFPRHYADVVAVLDEFRIDLAELDAGGRNRTPFVRRFDSLLEARGWGK